MFSFGEVSKAQKKKLHPVLNEVLDAAIVESPVDFGVLKLGGARTADDQRGLWEQGRFGHPGKIVTEKDGFSLLSEHQIKADGFGYAVDSVPFLHGQPTWNWEYIFPMIKCIATTARAQGVSLRWGGVWDRKLEELNLDDLEGDVTAYCARHPGVDRIDGPHLEYLGKIETPKPKAAKK